MWISPPPTMIPTGQEPPPPLIEIDAGLGEAQAMEFTMNGEYLVSGGDKGVRMWRMVDGSLAATMNASRVCCLAVSKDGRWIAAGTQLGEWVVWDAKTYERVFTHWDTRLSENFAVDFAPNSSRFVASAHRAVSIWEVKTCKLVRSLHQHNDVRAAKYSPKGDRIATATWESVRVYDSHEGNLLREFRATVTPRYNTGLLWVDNYLFLVADSKIHQFNVSTGSTTVERQVPDSDSHSSISPAKNRAFLAYAAKRSLTFWHTSTFAHLGRIEYPQEMISVACSPDDRFLAISRDDGKIHIQNLPRVMSFPLHQLHPTFQEPNIQIDDATLVLWKRDQLTDAEASLTAAILASENPNHHLLASRSLVRTRLAEWDTALLDAQAAIAAQPSVIGYIAKSLALVGNGDRHDGYRACDIAFERFHSSHVTFLLLIKAVIVFIAGEYHDAISRLDDLIVTVHFNSTCYMARAYMYLSLGNLKMKFGDYGGASQFFKRALQSLEHSRNQMPHDTTPLLSVVSLISGWKFENLGVMIQQRLCEAYFAACRIKEAVESLLELVHANDNEVASGYPPAEWISDFAQRCLSFAGTDDDAIENADQLLREWAKAVLMKCTWKDALVTTTNFVTPTFSIYQTICERLEATDQIPEAGECFRQMVGNDLVVPVTANNQQLSWALNFRYHCLTKLENYGDKAMDDKQHDNAILQYSAALSFHPTTPQGLLVKRSKAYIAKGLCEEALNDADKVIKLDPFSPWGYEKKHAALHLAKDYENAISAFEMMLSNMVQSSDEVTRELHRQYINPEKTKMVIRNAVQDAIRDSPRVLINTHSGRLADKSEQAASFESLPVFYELISSMTTNIDQARIEQAVTQYYRYAMFSHKWEDDEPLYQMVIRIVVYDLEESLTHDKLRTFCKIVRDDGLHWAWSDTCCINKADHFVLQEALVSMFKWYQNSAKTLVLLRGVRSPSRRGDLVKSVWNTRAWTFQEYHASRVVRFYNEDWTLYMNIDIPNHKESPEILSEMEEATGVSARALMAIRPSLDDIRVKLCLASTRRTTLVEDAAYSLLGIFSMSLPVVYGEGDQALGRLLAQLLTSSGDTSILAWTGRPGRFNSCLPSSIIVFNQPPTSHIPLPISATQMQKDITTLGASLDLVLATKLYEKLDELRVPSFSGKRMTLPCIVFKLGPLSVSRITSDRVFRAQTDVLGIVEIKTEEDLSRFASLYLVHPWIDYLLDRQPIESNFRTILEESTENQPFFMDDSESSPSSGPSTTTSQPPRSRSARFASRLGLSFGGGSFGGLSRRRDLEFLQPPSYSTVTRRPSDVASLRPPSTLAPSEKHIHALRALARLTRPFGALLLTPSNVAAYRRVATESSIMVQIEAATPTILNKLIDNVRLLDVL